MVQDPLSGELQLKEEREKEEGREREERSRYIHL